VWMTFTVSNSWRPAQEKKGSWVSFGAFWHGGVHKAPDERCESHATTRTPGDELGVSDRVELVLVIYTDGITEATGEGGDEFGEGQLVDVIRNESFAPVPPILDAVLGAVRNSAEVSKRTTSRWWLLAVARFLTARISSAGRPCWPSPARRPTITSRCCT